MPNLPHAYPFRLVEPGGVGAPSLGASLPRQAETAAGAAWPLTLAVEAMAQSILAAPPPELAGPGSAEGARLAGIEQARLLATIAAGDRLEARAELAGRFGPAARVRCRLERDGTTVAEATLLVTFGG